MEADEQVLPPVVMESPVYRPLSIKSTEKTLLAKWDLIEEKAGLEIKLLID